jgi:glucan biosynthesis protein C
MNSPEPIPLPSTKPQPGARDAAFDYLRSFVIVLVVFLHAALAYTGFSVFDYSNYVKSTAPVVDAARWPLLDLPVLFSDTFAMPLLFLVSGIFAISSLRRRGGGGFFAGRLRRLGVPFVLAVLILMPFSFWPSYLQAGIGTPLEFWTRYFTTDGWQTGLAWFLWLLLAFDGIAAMAYKMAPTVFEKMRRGPTALVVFLITALVVVPVYSVLSPYQWLSVAGFIDVQPARVPLYFAFFLMGLAFGSDEEWLARGPEYWAGYLALGILSGVLFVTQFKTGFGIAFAFSCAGVSLGLLGAFRKLVRARHPVLDSLSKNSFGIYLLHDGFVHWIQFALLPLAAPAWLKFVLAFLGGLALAWGATALLRQIPAFRRSKIPSQG